MTQFDKTILHSLWQWKLLTTAAVTELHFPTLTPSYAHRRLLRLKKAGLITWLHLDGVDNGKSFAWTLTKKGFSALVSELPDLREVGFKSESVTHDLTVAAIQLGEWVYGMPEGCDLFTEQQLRRYHVELYPDWVPHTTTRRPDGYWLIQKDGNPMTVALEVELSPKTPTEYRAIAQFYSRHPELLRVVWLVKSKGIAKAIYSAIQEAKGDGMRLHNFLLEKDFVQSGWDTHFFLGRDIGKPLHQLLTTASATPKRHVASTLLLNTLKSPHRSTNYLSLRKILNPYRLGSTLVSTPLSSLPSTNL